MPLHKTEHRVAFSTSEVRTAEVVTNLFVVTFKLLNQMIFSVQMSFVKKKIWENPVYKLP